MLKYLPRKPHRHMYTRIDGRKRENLVHVALYMYLATNTNHSSKHLALVLVATPCKDHCQELE